MLVVFGHSIQFGSGADFLLQESYFENTLFQGIYSFHMPLFALVSGYLFYWSMRKTTLELIKKQVFSLVVPIISWIGLESSARAGIDILQGEFNLIQTVKGYLGKVPFLFWFLWTIFLCSMIVLFVERNQKTKWWVYATIFAASLFFPSILNLSRYAYIFPYFVTGYLFHKYRNAVFAIRNKYLLLVISVIAFAGLLVFYDRDCFIYTTGISLLEADSFIKQLGIDLYRWIIGFIGSIVVIIGCKMFHGRFEKTCIVHLIEFLGRVSLGVYILNTYTNQYVLRTITQELFPNFWLWTVETFLCVLMYSVVIYVIKKFPIANKLLLGGR